MQGNEKEKSESPLDEIVVVILYCLNRIKIVWSNMTGYISLVNKYKIKILVVNQNLFLQTYRKRLWQRHLQCSIAEETLRCFSFGHRPPTESRFRSRVDQTPDIRRGPRIRSNVRVRRCQHRGHRSQYGAGSQPTSHVHHRDVDAPCASPRPRQAH